MMHQIGAVFYLLWGVLHLFAAMQVYKLGSRLEPGMVRGRIFQNAFNLAYFAVFVIFVAVVYNWKDDSLGYWLNFITASITDIGFIFFILVPGYLPLKPGILGPILWILAIVFSSL